MSSFAVIPVIQKLIPVIAFVGRHHRNQQACREVLMGQFCPTPQPAPALARVGPGKRRAPGAPTPSAMLRPSASVRCQVNFDHYSEHSALDKIRFDWINLRCSEIGQFQRFQHSDKKEKFAFVKAFLCVTN